MDCKQIGLGVCAWFLGVLIPTMHHVFLHWPLASQQTNNIVTRSQHLFKSLPWIDWVYLVAMGIVGAVLIISGMKTRIRTNSG